MAKNAVQVGTESYGLKHLEQLSGFERRGGIEQGAGAVVEYEQYMHDAASSVCSTTSRATTRMTSRRPWRCATGSWPRAVDLEWRDAVFEVDDARARHRRAGRGAAALDERRPGAPARRPAQLLAARALGEHRAEVRRRRRRTSPRSTPTRTSSPTCTFLGFEAVDEPRRRRSTNAIFTWPDAGGRSAFADQEDATCSSPASASSEGYGYVPSIDFDASRVATCAGGTATRSRRRCRR